MRRARPDQGRESSHGIASAEQRSIGGRGAWLSRGTMDVRPLQQARHGHRAGGPGTPCTACSLVAEHLAAGLRKRTVGAWWARSMRGCSSAWSAGS